MSPERQQQRARNRAAHNAKSLHEHAEALRQIEAPGLRYKVIAAQVDALADELVEIDD